MGETLAGVDIRAAHMALSRHPDYRVLRRIPKWTDPRSLQGEKMKIAAFVDVETTGLDPKKHKVIEVAIIPFTYGVETGRISNVFTGYQSFNDPGEPISPEITKITGITDEMVKGKSINPDDIEAAIGAVNLCIAHHAEFDRRFVEAVCPLFADVHWACSMEQVPWGEAGIAGRKLEYIGMSLGFFYDKHRAVDDCMAAIHFLDTMLLDLGKTAMQLLLEEARKPVYRVWSGPVSFDEARNEKLKAAGYRWNPDVKQWHKVVSPEGPDELGFLLGLGVQHAYFNPLSGKDRFTDRG